MYEITATVENMTCPKCEARVSDIIRENFAVKKVKADHDTDTVIITAEQEIELEKLQELLVDTKFSATAISSVEKAAVDNSAGLFGFMK